MRHRMSLLTVFAAAVLPALAVAGEPPRIAFDTQLGKVVVKPGDTLTLRYGILLHAGKKPDLEAAYRDYLAQIGQAGR